MLRPRPISSYLDDQNRSSGHADRRADYKRFIVLA
jgi:hypothetical protein